jgi:hypothetical protein
MKIVFHIGAFVATEYYEANGEDGPYTATKEYPVIEAQTDAGNRWYSAMVLASLEDAQAAIACGAIGDPQRTPDAWIEGRPVYGSDAWGPDDEYESACFEADCYNEPRPERVW